MRSLKNSLRRVGALTSRNLLEILRDPLSLAFLFLLPGGMEILFYFLFHALTPQFSMDLLAPGMVVFGQAFLSLFLGLLIAQDRESSFIVRLYTTGIYSFEFLLSYALAALPIALLQGAFLLLIGAVITPSLFSLSLLLSLFAGMIPALLFLALGILFGSLCSSKAVGGVCSIVVTGQSVLSGMWFPLDGLSEGFLFAMNALPFRNASVFLQNVASGRILTEETGRALLILLAYTLVLFSASVLVYRAKMRRN